MPEWTVQKVRWIPGDTNDSKNYLGRHCVFCNEQLWTDFDLGYKYVICRINSILDDDGKIKATIGEEVLLESRKLLLYDSIITDFPSTRYASYLLLIFPKNFVNNYGLRKDEYVDLLLTGISTSSDKKEVTEEIYPKRFVRGQIDKTPTGGIPKSIGITEPLIEQSLAGEFYKDLIQEINLSYSYQLNRSTLVLIRILLQNLLIDLLRTKFGTSRLELFYNKDRGQFYEFFKLLENLSSNKTEFN